MEYREAVRLSWLVRQLCLEYALSEKSSRYDFHACFDLECMCAVASMALRKASKDKFRVMMGRYYDGKNYHSHCWAEYGLWTFDLTATQFGVGIPVLILRNDKWEGYNRRYWSGKEKNRYRDFDWGIEQSPTPRLIKAILEG